MLQKRVLLSVLILTLAVAAVYVPNVVLVGVIGFLGATLVWRYPLIGLVGVLLMTTTGELVTMSISGVTLTLLDLAAPAVFGLWLVRKVVRRESWMFDRSGLLLVGFWAVATLSLLIGSHELTNHETLTATLYLVRFITLSGLYFVARDIVTEDAHAKRRFAQALLAVGVLLAISGLILLKLIPDFTTAGLAAVGWDPHIGRLTTAWLDPNFAGGGFAFLLAFVGAHFLAERKFEQKVILSGLALLFLVALLLTYSRSGLLALALAGGLLGLIRSRKLLIGGMALALIGIGASERLQSRLGEFAQSVAVIGQETQRVLDPTAALRVASWQEGFRVWSEAPLLGVGFGAYGAHQQFVDGKSHAATGSDASLLNVGAMTGGVGVTVFLALLASIGGTAWHRRDDPLALGLLTGSAGLLACAIFVNALFFPPLAVYLFTTAGAISIKKHGK